LSLFGSTFWQPSLFPADVGNLRAAGATGAEPGAVEQPAAERLPLVRDLPTPTMTPPPAAPGA